MFWSGDHFFPLLFFAALSLCSPLTRGDQFSAKMKVWVAISSHGFGHAAQVVPVLNAWFQREPNLFVILRCAVDRSFFEERLLAPFHWEPDIRLDVGCIQTSPVEVDIEATFAKHDALHSRAEEVIASELKAMAEHRPQIVLASHPYLALEAGKRFGIPTVALVGFTWADALQVYASTPKHLETVAFVREKYREFTDLAIRIVPAPEITLFRRCVSVGAVAEAPVTPRREDLARAVKAGSRHIVLIAFGGIQVEAQIDFPRLATELGKQFVFVLQSPLLEKRVPSELDGIFVKGSSLKDVFSFKELMASSDLVLSKPGYGTAMEMVALQKCLIYIRRGDFVDEEPIVNYLHRYGKGVELSLSDFVQANWRHALEQSLSIPEPLEKPNFNGASEAAEVLVNFQTE